MRIWIFSIIFLVNYCLTAQIDYIAPCTQAKVKHMGLNFEMPFFETTTDYWHGGTIYAGQKLKIKLPKPSPLTTDNEEYKLLGGFAIYNQNDSLYALVPDLYNGEAISTVWDLNELSYSLIFESEQKDSSRLKVILFGKDQRSGDSFTITFPVIVLKEQIETNAMPLKNFSNYRFSIGKSLLIENNMFEIDNVISGFNYDTQKIHIFLNNVSFSNSKLDSTAFYLESAYLYDSDGITLATFKNSLVQFNNNSIEFGLTLPPFKTVRTSFIHYSIRNRKNKDFVLGVSSKIE